MTSIRPRQVAWYGCRRDTKDARDLIFKPRAKRLPAKVDLRPDCPPVMDQGELGSCTAHGITGTLRYMRIKAGKGDCPMSRLQLYYDERAIEHSVNDDSGAEIRDGIKCAVKLGVAHENLWPYNIAKFKEKPPANVYSDAMKMHALKYQRVNVNATAIKQALAAGLPVVIGITVYDSFESSQTEKTGVLPMPDLHKEQEQGGHCMYVVGYGQKKGYFTVRNSWAADWGDKGDMYIPTKYLGSPKFGSDYWVVSSEEM